MDFQSELLSIINTVLTNNGRKTLDCVSPESDLRRDLALDSFDLAELTVRIQAKFDVDVFADANVSTVGEIIEKLKNR